MLGNGSNVAIMNVVELVQLSIRHHAKENNYLIACSIDEFDHAHVQRSTLAIKISDRNMVPAAATGLQF
ncbi:unnamed protein product [Adineta steineri]|uniref:Uncharacterized protein n=1 Tax=Adineta steineri TaxID=433720 RepID=A0A820BXC4_9BILA|nr:unnamed protein product [Adineta steineri]CAF4214569.1 unnamed protein product [Adineta steineri]